MKMKKIGILAMALVMVLGLTGAAFAAWTDDLTIEGTVNTGNVDLDVEMVSSTFVYKVPGAGDTGYGLETVVNHVHGSTDPNAPMNGILIASAIAEDISVDGANTVTFTYNNLFPCIPFVCDVLLHYNGSIPVKVNDISWNFAGDEGDWISPLVVTGDIVGYAKIFYPDTHEFGAVVEEGYQLHYCDYVKIWLVIHLPQDPDLMNRSGTGTATFEVVQWNEYPYPPA